MNAIKTIRNNWKKSVAFVAVCGFGIRYGDKKYRERLTLKAYCLEAKKYGDEKINGGLNQPRKVTVFLNPRANRSKGKELYEKNVAPLLHLAGLEVTLVQTEYEGQVKRYMEVLDPTDAIVIAGGDGTVSEVVTGLLRRPDEEQFSKKTALGVIPIGETNTFAKSLCPPTESTVTFLAEMAMSIIKGVTRPVDVMQITSTEDKSVYAVTGLEWGAYTDSEMRKTKNWYFGPLKHRLAYVVTALRYWPPTYKASVSYSLPCAGCSRCYVPPPKPQWRWWHIFMPRHVEVVKDYSNVVNEECGQVHQFSITTSQLTAKTSLDQGTQVQQTDVARSISLDIVPDATGKSDFIGDGWRRLKGEPLNAVVKQLEVGEFTVEPEIPTNGEAWFKIDNERFELMNMRCKLLPQKLRFMFSDSWTVATDSLSQTH